MSQRLPRYRVVGQVGVRLLVAPAQPGTLGRDDGVRPTPFEVVVRPDPDQGLHNLEEPDHIADVAPVEVVDAEHDRLSRPLQ